MLKRLILLSMGIFLSSSAFAAPQYDSKAWASYIEDGKGVLPQGMPTGRGSIGTVYWSKSGLKISAKTGRKMFYLDRPIDFSSDKNIVLSDGAYEAKLTFGSQTTKEFIDAVSSQLKQLTGKSLPVPVKALAPENPADYDLLLSGLLNPTKLWMGAFGMNLLRNVKAFPSVSMRDGEFSILRGSMYKGTLEQIEEVKKRIRESQVNLTLMSFDKRMEYVAQVYAAIREEKLQSMKKLREARENELGRVEFSEDAYLEEMQEVLNLPKEQQKEALNQLHAKYNLRSSLMKNKDKKKKEPLSQEERIRNEERVAKQNAWRADKAAYEFDAGTTWYLFEAMLTQTQVEVVSIEVGRDFYQAVLQAAKSLNRPAAHVALFEEKAKITRGNSIHVELGCSVRDRFLGCASLAPKADEAVNKRAKKMLASLSGASEETQVRILELLMRANVSEEISSEIKAFAKDSPSSEVRQMGRRAVTRGEKQFQQKASRAVDAEILDKEFEIVRRAGKAKSESERKKICEDGKDEVHASCMDVRLGKKRHSVEKRKNKCQEKYDKKIADCESNRDERVLAEAESNCQDVAKKQLDRCLSQIESRQSDKALQETSEAWCRKEVESFYKRCKDPLPF